MSDKSPQDIFDETYITSWEIQRELSVTRAVIIYAKNRGMLPKPVIVPGSGAFLWDRKKARPRLDAWKLSLKSRRGELEGELEGKLK